MEFEDPLGLATASSGRGIDWLAVLVIKQDELSGGSLSQRTTLGAVLSLRSSDEEDADVLWTVKSLVLGSKMTVTDFLFNHKLQLPE